MDLDALQRIKRWHVRHARQHPVECHAWDAMLTLWVIGWVGWMPVITFGVLWAVPFLALGMAAPTLYVSWRVREHRAHRLRCDWIAVR